MYPSVNLRLNFKERMKESNVDTFWPTVSVVDLMRECQGEPLISCCMGLIYCRVNFQTLLSVLENAKEELMYLNKTGDNLVNDVDDQLVNSAPIQEQLAKLNATYRNILDKLEQEQIKLDMVSLSFSNL